MGGRILAAGFAAGWLALALALPAMSGTRAEEAPTSAGVAPNGASTPPAEASSATSGTQSSSATAEPDKGAEPRTDTAAATPNAEPEPVVPSNTSAPAPDAAPSGPSAAAAAPADPIVAAIRAKLADPAIRKGVAPEDLAALQAFYSERTENPLWITSVGFSARAQAVITEIENADDWGLPSDAFDLPPPADLPPNVEAQASDEVKLDIAILKYARYARGGRISPARVSPLIDQKPDLRDPKTMLKEIGAARAPDSYLRGLHPKHVQFERLRQALLRERGKGKKSNPAEVQRIIVNMERWRWMPADLGSYYVQDNIPEFVGRVVKNGKVVYATKVVVGLPKYATPIFSADMRSIVFNPDWTVPETIVMEDLAPALKADTGPDLSILRDHELNVSYEGKPVDPATIDWGRANVMSYTFIQPPGPDNVLGKLKFNFPNRHAIYMHDTIQPEVFDETVRMASHGCIRVFQPAKLATFLLSEDKGWSEQKVREMLAEGHDSVVSLSRKFPVHLTYFTMTVDEKGKAQTFADIYGLDAKMASALFGKASKLDELEAEANAGATGPRRRAAWNSGHGGLTEALSGLFGN
ncbi:L,D-transpeptidase family protein [Methyloceanibacter sp.]|uniref:L,D-transpeptidase family protein n=1 Tax=Methyloceanibacter sp. TaxID=1965321 RepID=UPI002D67FDAB|nr:L,D-transpeptidase family protein [Methyloceanibacter sp.]HZP08026.1 L,D-transpeptidase family protein [Methyloceanibacter sp.]